MPNVKRRPFKPAKKVEPRVPLVTMVTPILRDQIDELAERQSRTRSKILELAAQRFVEAES